MGLGKYVLDAGGEVVREDNLTKWGMWMESANRKLKRSEFEGGYVSTVFLGLDNNFRGGPPILWETMVFGGGLDGEMERYETREEALKGHEKMVLRVEEEEGMR